MRVPVSFTSSAVTPSRRPSRLTRSRNAGGNAYSRPQSKPTFMAASSHVVRARGLLDAVAGFLDERLYNGAQIVGAAVHLELAVGARPVGEDRPHVLDLASAIQLVDDIVDELEKLERELAHRHFCPAAEVDQLAVEPPARRPPLVLFDQAAMIRAEAEVSRPQLVQLDDDRLGERGDGDRCARSGRHVADAELQRSERRMRADV